MRTAASTYRRGWPSLTGLDFDRLARPLLIVAVLASGLLMLHLTRGTSFWADDWIWIATRRGNTVNAFLAPYNGHLSLVPILIYRLMFAVFGIGSYTPYRAVVIALSLLVAVLVFVYVRTRAGETVALLATASMLFLGPGWQDMIWAFQIPWLIVCAAGIVVLMLIERRTWSADAGACALTLVAICSTSFGLAFATGIAIDLALTRRRWRDAWIVLGPLVVYGIWTLYYHSNLVDVTAIPTIPLSIAKAAALTLSVLAGLSGIRPFDDTGTSFTYGWPLLVIASALVLWRARIARPTARAVALAATFAGFAGSVSIVHGELSSVLSSRYIYVYCLLAVLLAAELARGIRLPRSVQASLCFIALAAMLSNIGSLRASSAYLRASGATTKAALAAIDLDRGRVAPSTVVRVALYQILNLSARSYFDAERGLGSPAYTVAQLRHADALAQSTADSQLLADGDLTLTSRSSSTTTVPSGINASTTLAVLASTNGTAARAGPCVRFTPAAALAPGRAASVFLAVGPGALSVTATAAPATLSARRFAPTRTPVGTVGGRSSAMVRIRSDAASGPWYLELSSIAPIRACTLRP